MVVPETLLNRNSVIAYWGEHEWDEALANN